MLCVLPEMVDEGLRCLEANEMQVDADPELGQLGANTRVLLE